MSGPTISVVHKNAAKWHHNRAAVWYGRYLSYLNEKGLHHPDVISEVRFCLSNFRYHSQVGDFLLTRAKAIRRRYRGNKPDTRKFANEFELALQQRGQQAKEAACLALT